MKHTPDLILHDSSAQCAFLPRPVKGTHAVGLVMYHPFYDNQFNSDYHELIQGTLARPLEKGKKYRISFYTRTSDSLGIRHLQMVFGRETAIRPVRCGNFGFWFSESRINPHEDFMQSQLDFPVKPQVNVTEIVTAPEWRKISLAFTADKPYRYFLFGNFFSDAVTPINIPAEEREKMDKKSENEVNFWKKTKRIAYYCFDNFSLIEDDGKTEGVEKMLLEQKTFTFNAALLFNSGAAQLRSEALPAVQELADALKKNPALSIEVAGHTDDTGSEADNQRLSEQRADAVRRFLLEQGVSVRQVQAVGYGEAQPVAPNTDEAGRQQNRRVEIKPRS
jgi:outer membrane protein OmpA-like peptidoglycan-associated protein